MNYIMITPVKNEGGFLTQTAISVLDQTELPKIWVIIDGGSTDKTKDIIKGLTDNFYWIKSLQQSNFTDTGDGHTNVSYAVKEAYTFANDYCNRQKIPFGYIWTIDGDQTFESNLCEGIIIECFQDPGIGAASGQVYNEIRGKQVPDRYPSGELSNKRVYRREALDQIGGFPITKYSYDTVILAKMRMAGWKIKTFPKYMIINLREDTGLERDQWKSYIQFGKARHYLGYSLQLVIVGCIYLMFHGKFIKSLGVFLGYFTSLLNKENVIEDKQVWKHFHYDRIKEVLII